VATGSTHMVGDPAPCADGARPVFRPFQSWTPSLVASGASPTQYYGERWPARFERSPAVIHLVRVQPSTGAAIASTTEQLGRAVRLAEDASQVVV
jgi:hypothetical protein